MLMEYDRKKIFDDFKKMPSLELLINSIDRKVETIPSPYGDVEFAASFSSNADAIRKQGQQYIRFSLAGTDFALPLLNALEIDYIPEITPLPNLPKWVLGICHLRGDIVSVVDLKLILQLRSAHSAPPRKIVLIRDNNLSSAVMVDDVASMRYAEDRDTEVDKRSVEKTVQSKFVDRIIQSDERLVHLLDVGELMTALKL